MKKSLCICMIICAAALVSILFAFIRIDRERENIVITEEVLAGDPAWAEGITLEFLTHWDNHALFDTQYTIGNGKTETEFCFKEDAIRWARAESEYFELSVITSFGTAMDANATDSAKVNIQDMWIPLVLEAVASRTGNGQTHVEQVKLSEYYEYNCIALNALSQENDVSYYSNWVVDFSSFFHAPTQEDELLEVSVTKNENGFITAVESRQIAGGFAMDTTYDYGEEGCLFTFVCWDPINGERVAVGENSGLFYIPYVRESRYGHSTLDTEQIKKVCDIPKDAIPTQILWEEESERLYMVYQTNEDYRLAIYNVDNQSAELQQEVLVLEKEHGEESLPAWWGMSIEEKGILLKWEYGRFSYVTESAGEFYLWCSNQFVPAAGYLQEEQRFLYEHALLFEGDRLIIGCYEGWDNVNMTVAVYSPQEQLYCGCYHHSSELELYMTGISKHIYAQGIEEIWNRHSRMNFKSLRILRE